MNAEELKYPVGRFDRPTEVTEHQIIEWISDLRDFPSLLTKEVEGLGKEELQWSYRPGGWTIQQVIHHCADSHMNSFIRFKLALTEDNPTIKAYHEDRWAEMTDYSDAEMSDSLNIIEGLHNRWVRMLDMMTASDFKKTFHHPEMKRDIPLEVNLALYSWHCKHHLAHIRQAKKHKGKFS